MPDFGLVLHHFTRCLLQQFIVPLHLAGFLLRLILRMVLHAEFRETQKRPVIVAAEIIDHELTQFRHRLPLIVHADVYRMPVRHRIEAAAPHDGSIIGDGLIVIPLPVGWFARIAIHTCLHLFRNTAFDHPTRKRIRQGQAPHHTQIRIEAFQLLHKADGGQSLPLQSQDLVHAG